MVLHQHSLFQQTLFQQTPTFLHILTHIKTYILYQRCSVLDILSSMSILTMLWCWSYNDVLWFCFCYKFSVLVNTRRRPSKACSYANYRRVERRWLIKSDIMSTSKEWKKENAKENKKTKPLLRQRCCEMWVQMGSNGRASPSL